MRRFVRQLLALTLVLAMPAVPAAAVELGYDDGSMEMGEFVPSGYGHAVSFDLPAPEAHALTGVSFYLIDGGPQPFDLIVRVWDDAQNLLLDLPVTVDYVLPGWYDVDLAASGLTFTGSFVVGVLPTPSVADLYFGTDLDGGTGHSVFYGENPEFWFPIADLNYGIRATVEAAVAPPAPAADTVLACRGFAPPLNRPRSIRRGARALPLKARLLDADGGPVGGDALATPPAVQVLFTPAAGGVAVDVTDLVAPAGRSNEGRSFRPVFPGGWRYVLRTRGLVEQGTYEILLVSGDPAEYVVEPACSAILTLGGDADRRGGRGPRH